MHTLFALLALLAGFSAHAADLPTSFEGTWTATGGNRDAAIDAIVSEMSFFKRPFARTRLNRVTKPCDELAFASQRQAIAIRCDDQPVAADTPDGRSIAFTDASGVEYQLSIDVRGDAVEQTFASDAGRRTNTYRVSGDTLNLQVTVSSDRLPRDLTYTRTFRRVGPATSS